VTAFTLTVSLFVVVFVAAVALQLAARRRPAWPVLGDVFTVLAASGTGRFLVMLGWWWLGWHFFVR
jgi:Family of unknown function (DUF6186)